MTISKDDIKYIESRIKQRLKQIETESYPYYEYSGSDIKESEDLLYALIRDLHVNILAYLEMRGLVYLRASYLDEVSVMLGTQKKALSWNPPIGEL